MPAPPKTTDAKIVQAARNLIERSGAAGFSMSALAASVGIRTPSLYGRFADSAALLEAVELDVLRALDAALATVPPSTDPVATLRGVSRAYRRFAKSHPQSYLLLYGPYAARSRAVTQVRAAALEHALPALAALVGDGDALLAARTLVPFMHGFVSMEISGAFHLGPGLDSAFEHGVATILGRFHETAPKGRSSALDQGVRMSFIIGLMLLVGVVGRLDSRLPWPAPKSRRS
ncbi:MAG: TetR/AcrR family transcriptional regulator [Polyangiaceae bacterium]